jgi:hypothetical protein
MVDAPPGARQRDLRRFDHGRDGSTIDANGLTLLAQRSGKGGGARAVLNEGISGAKVLSDRMGTKCWRA